MLRETLVLLSVIMAIRANIKHFILILLVSSWWDFFVWKTSQNFDLVYYAWISFLFWNQYKDGDFREFSLWSSLHWQLKWESLCCWPVFTHCVLPFKHFFLKMPFSLQAPLFPSLLCGSWSHQFGWFLQPSGRLWSRRLCQTMGCLRSLCLWSQKLFLSFSLRGSALNSSWDSEHEWVGRI